MWIALTTRRGLATALERGGEAPQRVREVDADDLERLRLDSEIALLWRDRPDRDKPVLQTVLVRKEEQKDFLAWVATYYPLKPFTAFVRVMDPETAGAALGPSPLKLDESSRSAVLGLILGEGLGESDNDGPSDVAYRTCLSTCSFALAKAATAGFIPRKFEEVTTLWAQAQRTRRHVDTRQEDVLWPWLVFLDSIQGSQDLVNRELFSDISNAYREIVLNGGMSPWALRSVIADLSLVGDEVDVVEALGSSREQRVVNTERLLRQLVAIPDKDTARRRMASFLAGYLVSRIAPGTIDHLNLLKSVQGALPAARLWYGLFAGIHSESALSRFGAGFGSRIYREAFRRDDFWNAPTSDVSLSELQMLLGAGASSAAAVYRFTENGRLDVELLPNVSTPVFASTAQQAELFPAMDIGEVRRLVTDLRNALAHADQAQHRLERVLGSTMEAAQRPGVSRRIRRTQ